MNTNGIFCCHWCGIDLSRATSVKYLNGNLPCCDLCLHKASISAACGYPVVGTNQTSGICWGASGGREK